MNIYFAFSIALVSILSYNGLVFAQNDKPLYTAPLGVQAYTFRKSFPLNVAKTLDTIKLMGFVEIEGGSNNITPADFRILCDERGISIPSTGAGYDELIKSS